MEWLVETGDGEPLFHYPFKGWGRINSSNRRWMGVNIACKGIASFALQLIKDNVSEKWLLTRISSSAFLEDTGKSGKSRRRSRMLVRLLAEKREQRGVEKAFRRWRSPDSQEGNSKECNFPRMYFVLSIVSTMNFSSSPITRTTGRGEGKQDRYRARPYSYACSINFDDRFQFSNLYLSPLLSFFPRKFATRTE